MKRLLPLALLALVVGVAVAAWPRKALPPPAPDATPLPSSEPTPPSTPSIRSTPSIPPDAAVASAAAPATEEQLTARVRALVDERPEEALALVAEADKVFPAGRLADERSFLTMRALVHLDRIGAAREAAADFHRRFPNSPWAEQVVRLTGYRPRRYGPKR